MLPTHSYKSKTCFREFTGKVCFHKKLAIIEVELALAGYVQPGLINKPFLIAILTQVACHFFCKASDCLRS